MKKALVFSVFSLLFLNILPAHASMASDFLTCKANCEDEGGIGCATTCYNTCVTNCTDGGGIICSTSCEGAMGGSTTTTTSTTTSSTRSSSRSTSSSSSSVDCGTMENVGGICFPTSAETGLSDAKISTILTTLFSWLMATFSVLALIAFMISGIQYLTSAGSDKQITTAKTNAIWSIVGVLVGLSGFVIIQAIAAALKGTSTAF